MRSIQVLSGRGIEAGYLTMLNGELWTSLAPLFSIADFSLVVLVFEAKAEPEVLATNLIKRNGPSASQIAEGVPGDVTIGASSHSECSLMSRMACREYACGAWICLGTGHELLSDAGRELGHS